MQESGKTVEILARQIEIQQIQLKEYMANTITYEVTCSKGTYIRTLSEDIANSLGTVGYMSSLIRTKVNEFSLEQAIFLETLNKNSKIISIEEIFKEKENIELDKKKLELFLNGVQLNCNKKDNVYKIYYQKQFIGLRNNTK